MAKGRKKSKNDSATPVDVASPLLSSRVPRTHYDPQDPGDRHHEVEDNRRWDPDPMGRAKTTTGNKTRVVIKQKTAKRWQSGKPAKLYSRAQSVSGVTSRLGFSVPHDVIVCLRRAMRREVLFATKKRKAGAGAKRRRRNKNSHIDC